MRYIVSIFLFCVCFAGQTHAQKAPDLPNDNKTLVKFFPNPAVNYIIFEMKEPVERGTVIQVFSFLGRQIASVPVNAQRVTVNVSEYFRGIYVFQLRAPNGKIIETNKFQVNR